MSFTCYSETIEPAHFLTMVPTSPEKKQLLSKVSICSLLWQFYCSNTLSYPLYLFFTKSLLSGAIPDSSQTSHVVPIFKKGKKCDPLSYRPISLTSTPCKTLERNITPKLHQYLESNSILSVNQFGFRSGRSVEYQLLLIHNDVTHWMDNGNMIDLVLFDFAKAFDTVNHQILFTKLQCTGVEEYSLIMDKSISHRQIYEGSSGELQQFLPLCQ